MKCRKCNGDISEYAKGETICAWCREGEPIEFDICEHGLSAWLCMGPNHYPSRDDEMNGRYF